MIGGGYRAVNSELLHARTKARLNKQGVEVSDEKLAKHLEEFTPEIEKDMAYREQYARLHPLLPYAPEPNLFLDATAALRGSPRGTQLLFGEGGAEFTEMAKNVSRFAADELEHHFTERYEQGRGELRELGILEPDPEYSRLLEDVRTEMSIAAQNNRHPVRDIGVLADYSGLNVETDLSRIAATAYVNPRAAQSHAGLTTVVDRFFNTKGDKSKSGASKARDDFSKSLGKIPELSKLDPFDKKLGPGAFGLGGKMSEALSYPFSKGSLFSGMQFGVQSDQKKPFLFQTAIESARRAYFDEQAQNHVALIQNFRDNALPLHGQPGTRLRLQHWTKADGDCGIYSLGYLAGNQSLTRAGLAEDLRSMNTQAAWNAANGISGFNAGLWLSIQQLVTIAGLLGMGDIAIVTLNPAQNTWGVLHGDPTTATHIIGGVPAGVGGAINHWVVLRRE
jgi:hypothetical protein